MLQDKKIKSSAKLQQNKKIKNVKNYLTKYHKRLYLKKLIYLQMCSYNVQCLSWTFRSFYV